MRKFSIFLLFFVLQVDLCVAGVSVIGKLTREMVLQPGEKFEGKIILKNTGETSHKVNVYQSDYLFYADGSNIYGEPGRSPRSNASWLSFSPKRITIPPNETASLYYALKVPKNFDMTGTYWSMIMIEPASETGPENIEDKDGKVKVGIQTRVRYGIQIVTNIGDTGARRVNFLDKKLISQEGKRILQMDIENTGERWLSPAVWVELYDPHGNKIARFESDKKRIYPDCSVRHRMDLTEIPEGDYKALVVVDNGDEYVFGAQYDLGIE
jgi:hypothetical protein